jgi:LPS export ABC transporter protein LptC
VHTPFIKIIRRSLIGIIIVVLFSVLLNYMQIWRSRNNTVKKAPEILSSELVRSAENLDYFDNKEGVPRFKIHARKLLETRAGKNFLEGIEANDFRPDGSARNKIRSQNAVYDQDGNVVDFLGNVQLFLGKDVELRTNSLHYDLNTNVGTTRDSLEFHSREARGKARGVHFNQKEGSLELGGDVDFVLAQQETRPGRAGEIEELHATSERAYCSEMANRILFQGKARIRSGSGTLSGDTIEVSLSADQKHVTSLNTAGNANYQSEDKGEKRTLSGSRMIFGIDASGALKGIEVSEQAMFSSISPSTELVLRGGGIDLEFDPTGGILKQIQSRVGVDFQMKSGGKQTLISGDQLIATFMPETKNLENLDVRKDASFSFGDAKNSASNQLRADRIRISFREGNGRALVKKLRAERSVQWRFPSLQNGFVSPGDAAWTLGASLLEMLYSEDGDYLESGSASGSVVISGISKEPSTGTLVRRLYTDSVQFGFFPGNNSLRDMDARGHVRLVCEEEPGSAVSATVEKFHTASDRMKVIFDQKNGTQEVKSLTQSGNFRYGDPSRSATAGRCDYDAETEVVVLKESPVISDEMGVTKGEQVAYDLREKVLSVRSRVRSILSANGDESSFFGASSPSSPIIVTAGALQYWTEDRRAYYTENVQLLSEDQQLQAQNLELLGGGERVEAQGFVLHLISGRRASGATSLPNKSQKTGNSASEPITVRSSNLEYARGNNALKYSGNVNLKLGDVEITSKILDAILDKEQKNVERATALGKVLIRQGARECRGEKADWYLIPGRFVVVGDPAEAYDPERGRSFARRLTTYTADDRILLEGR